MSFCRYSNSDDTNDVKLVDHDYSNVVEDGDDEEEDEEEDNRNGDNEHKDDDGDDDMS